MKTTMLPPVAAYVGCFGLFARRIQLLLISGYLKLLLVIINNVAIVINVSYLGSGAYSSS